MKASELRIGNLALRDDVVVTIDGRSIFDFWSSHAVYSPIILTEEWLLKFGFEKVAHDERDWYLSPLGLINPTKGLEKYGYITAGEFDKDIKFVHQLQNLYFALTGEELIGH